MDDLYTHNYITNHRTMPIGCVIMASGEGLRFGGNKLMADINSRPLISYIIETTMGLPFEALVVVTRSQEVYNFCNSKSVPVVLHQEPYRSDTVRLGLAALEERTSRPLAGCLFCQGDQPLVSAHSIQQMIQEFLAAPTSIYRLSSQSVPGSPILFPGKYFKELSALPQGKGGGFLAKKYPQQVHFIPAGDTYELLDVDTQEDLMIIQDLLLNM